MLIDRFSRKHNYLRISITDKCNLRCKYCMPPEGVGFLPHDEVLRNEEFNRLIRIFVEMGVDKIRFTGGEPLIRKGLMNVISGARKNFPLLEICLTTNGVLLGDFINSLVNMRVKKLNISLDTLSRERYKSITGIDAFEAAFHNIESARRAGFFDLKINSVLFPETIDELETYLEYFKDKNIMLRFIERMPFAGNNPDEFTPSEKLLDALKKSGSLIRVSRNDTQVAKMYDYNFKGSFPMKIGVISPISDKFCSSCNRLRLKSDGMLRTCLLSSHETDLKSPMRSGAGDEELKKIILTAVNNKEMEHGIDNCNEESGCASINIGSPMSKIGG